MPKDDRAPLFRRNPGDKERTRAINSIDKALIQAVKDIAELKKQVAAQGKQIAELKKQIEAVQGGSAGERGPAGKDGENGKPGIAGSTGSRGLQGVAGRDGAAGIITVEIIRDGKVSQTHPGVKSGSTVRTKISDKKTGK